MKLRPLQDRVLIRRVEPETKTRGGILIPDTAQEKPVEGEVLPALEYPDGVQPPRALTGLIHVFGEAGSFGTVPPGRSSWAMQAAGNAPTHGRTLDTASAKGSCSNGDSKT